MQLIPVPCTGDEILANYATFQSQIENPLLTQLSNEYLAANDPWIIIVGYGIPGGFYQDGNVISTQSRLSRMGHTPSWGMSNPLFGNYAYSTYDSETAEIALIVSRIDAPTLSDAMAMVDNIKYVQRKSVANGLFMFDKYATIDTDEYGIQDANELNYLQDLTDFETLTLPILNMTTFKTTFWDEYTDVVIPRCITDTFLWAWKADRTGYSFFENNTYSRIFLYNADTDGGGTMRDADDKRWPLVALTQGYAASAGATSDPLPEGYLRPKPFFNVLFQGGTIGEAFLASCPNLDWTVGLFGDPLIIAKFPNGQTLQTGYSLVEGFGLMSRDLQDALGYKSYGDTIVQNAFNSVFSSNDVDTIIDLSNAANRMKNVYQQTTNEFSNLVAAFENFPGTDLLGFLTTNSLQISKQIVAINPSLAITSSLLLTSGSWYFETPILSISTNYDLFQFELQVSLTEDFSDVILDLNTATSITGWTYEVEQNTFNAVPVEGVTSSYVGRRVRFTAASQQYFSSATTYYARIRQTNEYSDMTEWVAAEQVIGT
jgi:uncharacterized protein (TIGR03790 family)